MAVGIKRPAFIGRALLLSVPVLVLLAVGLNSLRQDRIQAHREAAERAQRLADTLTARGVAAFTQGEHRAGTVFQVDSMGELRFPPPLAPLSPAPLLMAGLTREQAELWRSAEALESQTNRAAEASEAYTRFLAMNPPPAFAANALYSLGLVYTARGEFAEAASVFRKLTERFQGNITEGGVPLQALGMLKLLELQSGVTEIGRVASMDLLCSNLISHPTSLSRALLRKAGQLARGLGEESVFNRWSELWSEHERARSLYAQAVLHSSAVAPSLAPGEATNAAPATPGGMNGQPIAHLTAETPEPNPREPAARSLKPLPLLSVGAFWFKAGADTVARQASTSKSEPASQDWLVVPHDNSSTGCWFACYPESQARTLARTLVDQAAPVADYLAAELTLAKRIVVVPPEAQVAARSPEENSRELLGSAARPEAGNAWMEARVFLTQPALLYRHQRARRWWFGALIASCAVAALVGLLANWSAFRRQQRLSEQKSNFVSSVSHELRTPVASVRLLVEGLESGRVSGAAKQKEYLHLMGQECRRLSGLIDNILDFSRIDDGRKQFEFSPTNVEALASETVKMLEPYASARAISLAVQAEGAAAGQSAVPDLDGLALRQALLNLLDNAIKHSPEGETVTVGVGRSGTDNGSCVSLWVEDHGGGIPAEEHEKIFERFYRRGSELSRETQGIGIGLTIVKHIVEAHGGRVLVRSALGQGSRFTMELPIKPKQEPTA